ncbi:hypothetical protein E1166_30605, partial [Micromonospora sp. KC213]
MHPNQPQHYPHAQAEADRQRAGFFRAGKVAAWVWVVATVVPILLIVLCCGLCMAGGFLGAVLPSPS